MLCFSVCCAIIFKGGDYLAENERIKEVRKLLGLSLEKFGNKLGVTKSAMSNIENANRNITEQMRKSICREYNVDYIWLTTGEGEMFSEADDDTLELIDRIMTGENEFHKNLFKTFARFDEDDLHALEKMIDKFIEAKKVD